MQVKEYIDQHTQEDEAPLWELTAKEKLQFINV